MGGGGGGGGVGGGGKNANTVEPPNKDQLGEMAFVPCREAVPISEASFLSPYFTILHL